MKRRTRAVALCLGVLSLAGCRTAVDVSIESDDTAGGEIAVAVELDAEAVEVLGGPSVLELDDLNGTSWVVGELGPTDDGGYRVEALRTFTDERDLQAGFDELAGPGVFGDVVSVVDNGFARTDAELSVDASVTGDLAQFSDDALTETLDGLPLGYTAEELAFIGAGEPDSATMTLRVEAPGGEPDEAMFELDSGEAQSVTLTSTGSDRDDVALLLGAGGAVLAVLGVVLLGVVLIRHRAS